MSEEGNIYDPKGIVKSKYPSKDDYLGEKKEVEFTVKQSYEDTPASTLVCKHCGNDQFKVAQASYFTAVKCVNCEYEIWIHKG